MAGQGRLLGRRHREGDGRKRASRHGGGLELKLSPGALLAALFAAAAGHASAQLPPAEWATIEQSVEIDLDEGATTGVEVVVHYLLGAGEPGASLPVDRPISFELLGFGEATADVVDLEPGGAVVLWPTVGSHRAATVFAPVTATGETFALTARYVVDAPFVTPPDDVRAHVRVPVLTGPPVRAEGGEAFRATVTVPPEWAVAEGFPSGLRADEPGVWAVSLSVAPSMVSFRARTDGRWRPGFPHLVDLLTVLVLGAFAFIGRRHLKGLSA